MAAGAAMADCRDCQRRDSLEKSLLSQKKAGQLQEFFSRLRVKDDPWKTKGRRGSADAVIHYREPRPSRLLEDGTTRTRQMAVDVFANFEDRIRDSGGGKSYLYAPILPGTGGLLEAVVLSAWDNVVGPKAVFVWTQLVDEEEEEIGRDRPSELVRDVRAAVQYAVSHTLHWELSRGSESGSVEVYVSEDHGFALCSVPFSAEGDTESSPHSLTGILPLSRLEHFVDLISLYSLWMQRLASSLRVLLHEVECRVAIAELSPYVTEFCGVLRSLSVASLAVSREIHVDDYSQDSCEFFSVKSHFLERAVTSHLQTCCNTVVIGDTVEEVNSVVRMLALFLRPRERRLVRLAVKGDESWPYCPGIYIQGMVKGVRGDLSISEDDVLWNPYPTTIVDLTQGKVLQSWLLHKHCQHRKLRFRKALASLLTNKSMAPVSVTTRNIFSRVTEASKMVRSFLTEVWAHECDAVRRRSAVARFIRQLEYQAFALVKFVQTASGCNMFNVTQCSPNRKNLRKMLDLDDDVDFYLILAVAERLRPGIYHVIMHTGGGGGTIASTDDFASA